MSTHRQLARSAGVIGGLTSVSRVLGFVRDTVIAAAFGTGVAAEAFVVSFKIPNLLRDLVGEGAANAAFVPVLTECREKNPPQYWPLVRGLFLWMSVLLLVLSALGVLFAPVIVRVLAPGFTADAEKFALTVRLTRVIFPYIFLIGLSALAMGVLNSMKEFASSAFGPILLNLCMITAGVFFERRYGAMALVIGVLAGGVLQLAWQMPPLFRRGLSPGPIARGTSYGKKIARLIVPRALGSALYQVNVLVDSVLASFVSIVGPGGQSGLYYANRLFQLPLAVFGLALAQAILPTFSIQMVGKDMQGFKNTFLVAIRSLVFVILPASAGLFVLSRPIVRILFERGRFDAYSTDITSSALAFYALGLLSCSLIKILANAFYAMQDTRTPVKSMLWAVSLNAALSVLLMGPLKIGGLALASSLSATFNAALLCHFLKKKTGPLGLSTLTSPVLRMAAATLVMAAAVFFYDQVVLTRYAASGRVFQSALLFGGILGAILLYIVTGGLLKVRESKKIFHEAGSRLFKK